MASSSSSSSPLASLLATPFVAPAVFAGAAVAVGALARSRQQSATAAQAAAAAAEKAAAAAKAEEHKKAQAAAADAARGKLRLIYWGGRGLMEPARMMCALSGTPFTDERHSWGNAMPEGAVVEANLGRMPVCVTPSGVSIGQSPAIWHYVAESTGMLGANATEAATIFAFASHFKELTDAFTALVPYGTEPTAAAFAAFFDEKAALDFSGSADMASRSKRGFCWYANRMEGLVGKDGFAVGNKTSLADILIFRYFGDVMRAGPENEKARPAQREPFESLARVAKALEKCPKLRAIIEKVRGNAKLAAYLASRPAFV